MSETETELRAALALGVEMRAAQKSYFRTRTPGDLRVSKSLESRFDDACDRIRGKAAPGLFDTKGDSK